MIKTVGGLENPKQDQVKGNTAKFCFGYIEFEELLCPSSGDATRGAEPWVLELGEFIIV